MNTLVARYAPSRRYLVAGCAALAMSCFSLWWSQGWIFALIPAVLFCFTAVLLLLLAFRPAIEIHDTHFLVGKRKIGWNEVRRVDRTGWISPLLVYVTLADNSRLTLIYSGDLDSANSLLRCVRRYSRLALIDGIPHRQFWGEATMPEPERRALPSPKYQLLREEDEAEVERLFQKLKTVGRLDKSSDEK